MTAPSRKAFRLAWAALLARVWNVDAMTCRRCGAPMRVVAGLTKPAVVERILRHLGLWDVPGPPARHACPSDPHPLFGQDGLDVAPEDLPDPDPGWPDADPPFPKTEDSPLLLGWLITQMILTAGRQGVKAKAVEGRAEALIKQVSDTQPVRRTTFRPLMERSRACRQSGRSAKSFWCLSAWQAPQRSCR